MARVPGAEKYMEVDAAGVSHAINSTLKPDWEKLQGPPSVHYAQAKANEYDFYAVTDHSQEPDFYPTEPGNAAWLDSKRAADDASDDDFLAIRGFEFSENNGPRGDYLPVPNLPYLSLISLISPGHGQGRVTSIR